VSAVRIVSVVSLVCAVTTTIACKRDPPVGGPTPIPTPIAPATAPKPPLTMLSVDTADAGDAATAGCGTAAASPRGTAYTTRAGRTFHVWGPATYAPGRRYPVMLTFHGWYANGRDFQKWFKMEDHVDGAAFTVYPDSSGPTWDVTGDRDLDFTAEIVESLSNAYCIDRAHVFALGFSYGGKFVHHLGCRRPNLVHAISVGDGSWAQESTTCRAVPVLVTHRTRDPDELIGCSQATDVTDAKHGCVAYRGCTAPGSVTFCEDTHFDAAWPSDWNHTIREEYRSLTWKWFQGVP
jgi:polyhydroxybutyrate depolymerase